MAALWKRYLPVLLSILALGIAADLIALAYPIVLKYLVDAASGSARWTSSTILLKLVLTVALSGTLASIARDYLSVRLSGRFDNEVNSLILSRILKTRLPEIKSRTTGEWLVILQQTQEVKAALGNMGTQAVFDALLVLGYTGLLFYYDKMAAALYCVLAFTTANLMFRLGRSLYAALDEGYEQKAIAETYVTEALRSPLLVRTYPLANWIQTQWAENYGRSVRLFQKSEFTGAVLGSVFDLVRRASPLFVIAWKLPAVTRGELSFGTVLALSSVFAMGFDPFIKFSTLIAAVQKALLSYRSIRDVERLEEETPSGSLALSGVNSPLSIHLENVRFRYVKDAPKLVLDDVTFKIHAGEKIALVGKSGSGKTSLLHLLLGLYRAESGQIYIGERNIAEIPTPELRRQVGIVSQDTEIFSGTILENIALGDPHPDLSRARECARLSNAAQFVERLPEGFGTRLGEGGSSVSAGQRQRIALARALYWNPRILLLDEPTSALDAITEREIASSLKLIGQHRTLVVAAHRLGTILDFDRIYVMEQGRMVEGGSHEELLHFQGHTPGFGTQDPKILGL